MDNEATTTQTGHSSDASVKGGGVRLAAKHTSSDDGRPTERRIHRGKEFAQGCHEGGASHVTFRELRRSLRGQGESAGSVSWDGALLGGWHGTRTLVATGVSRAGRRAEAERRSVTCSSVRSRSREASTTTGGDHSCGGRMRAMPYSATRRRTERMYAYGSAHSSADGRSTGASTSVAMPLHAAE